MEKYITEKEVWKDVVGYEGYYQVSNLGRVRSLDRELPHSRNSTYIKRGRVLKPIYGGDNYQMVCLRVNNKPKNQYIHRLVATTFIGKPQGNMEVNHKDGDKKNNKVSNLEWVTSSENTRHAYKNGLLNSKHARKKVIGTNIKTGEKLIFNSITEAADYAGVSLSSVSGCLRGRNGAVKSGGHTWKYADEVTQ